MRQPWIDKMHKIGGRQKILSILSFNVH